MLVKSSGVSSVFSLNDVFLLLLVLALTAITIHRATITTTTKKPHDFKKSHERHHLSSYTPSAVCNQTSFLAWCSADTAFVPACFCLNMHLNIHINPDVTPNAYHNGLTFFKTLFFPDSTAASLSLALSVDTSIDAVGPI